MEAQFYIPEKLRGFVDLISHQKSTQPTSWTFLPDGISCLLFKMKSESRFDIVEAKAMREEVNPSSQFCLITGFGTSPVHVEFEHFDYFGAYLRPIALKTLFGIAAKDIKDFAMDGSLVLSDLGMIEDRLNELTTFEQKAKWLEQWLYNRINETEEMYTALAINRLAEKITLNQFDLSSKQLQDFMGYSRAQTHRIFSEWFGLSSQKYQRLMKFVCTMKMLHTSNKPLTQIGFEHGYFDQAHFIRTFKEFTDMTPSQYLQNKSDLVAQYPTQ